MDRLDPALAASDPAWAALLGPLRPLLGPALDRLAPGLATLPPLGGPDGVELPPDLLGPGAWGTADAAWAAHHPELAPLALDRWRRAAGLYLEAVAQRALEAEVGAPLPRAWWIQGQVAEAVDRAAPELGWLWPEAADLLLRPHEGLAAAPRRAAWLFRWLAAQGSPPPPGERPELDAPTWAAFARWALDPAHGPAAACPLPLPRAFPVDERGFEAPPLSFRRLHARPGAPGLVLRWDEGEVALAGEGPVEALVSSLHGGPVALETAPALPLGTWRLAGGTVGERPGAARGIELDLRPDGRVEVVFADAFAGPPTPMLLGLARTLGVSGTGRGRYRVIAAGGAGQGTLVFEALEPDLLTVHPRKGRAFALPAETFLEPIHKALAAMTGVPWAFLLDEEGLRLEAPLFGASTVLRLVRPDP